MACEMRGGPCSVKAVLSEQNTAELTPFWLPGSHCSCRDCKLIPEWPPFRCCFRSHYGTLGPLRPPVDMNSGAIYIIFYCEHEQACKNRDTPHPRSALLHRISCTCNAKHPSFKVQPFFGAMLVCKFVDTSDPMLFDMVDMTEADIDTLINMDRRARVRLNHLRQKQAVGHILKSPWTATKRVKNTFEALLKK